MDTRTTDGDMAVMCGVVGKVLWRERSGGDKKREKEKVTVSHIGEIFHS